MASRRKKRRPLGDTTDPRGMPARIEQYLSWMEIKAYSAQTISNRRTYLAMFCRWCEERGLERPAEVTKPILERYHRHLFFYRKKNGEPLSFRSQHSRLVPVRAFFKWLARQNLILFNPASELELPRLQPRLPKAVLSAAEAEKVLSQPDVTSALGVRDRAMLETLYSTGMRRMELAHLRLTDIDRDRGTVMVSQGKGRKDRMIPIGCRALDWIARYIFEVRPKLIVSATERTLFVTREGEPLTPDHLTVLVRGYVDAAKLGKRGACHLLRHTMATLMLEGGADIRFIQQMLGHATVATTQLYTQVSIRALKQIHAATHPADREGPVPEPARPSKTEPDLLASALAAEDPDA